MEGLRQVRPRLIKGYEAMVMARLILEDSRCADVMLQWEVGMAWHLALALRQPGCAIAYWSSPLALPLLHAECSNIQRILSDWEPLLACTVERWGESHDGLAAAFEGLRAAQMRGNTQRWLALNPLYPGVAEALRQCPYPFYIASSKASSRLVTLLNASLGMSVDEHSPRLFASLIPPNEKKIEALRAITQRPVAASGATLHFVDDRFETLHAIAEAAPDLMARWVAAGPD
jgi:hypothetical protein